MLHERTKHNYASLEKNMPFFFMGENDLVPALHMKFGIVETVCSRLVEWDVGSTEVDCVYVGCFVHLMLYHKNVFMSQCCTWK